LTDDRRDRRDPDFVAEVQTRLIEQLHASEQRMRQLLADIPDVVFRLGQDGTTLDLNAAWSRLLGWEVKRSEGTQFIDHVHKEDRQKWTDLALEAAGERLVPAHGVIRFLHADGTDIWMKVTLRHLDSGEMVGTLHDVTIQRELESEMLKTQRLESLGRLAGGLAHDINNLLMVILGNVDLARDHLRAQGLERAELDLAARACDHARKVTHQMLTFSKGGAPVTSAGSLEELVTEAVEMTLRGASAEWELQVIGRVPEVEMDANQIHQVISNVVLNAEQSMSGRGTIEIALEETELPSEPGGPPLRAVELRVMDEGTGIPPENLAEIFDPYFTTKPEGNGLGLTTAFWIVQRHSGSIDVESAPGRGTTVRITLPVAVTSDSGVKSTEPLPLPTGGLHVLLMDDNDLVRASLTAMLTACGHVVVGVNDGDHCVETYGQSMGSDSPFDLVLLDLVVSGGHGGLWTIRELQEIDPGVRAIVASGYGNNEAIANHREHGFRARLQKPFRMDDLRAAIQEAVAD